MSGQNRLNSGQLKLFCVWWMPNNTSNEFDQQSIGKAYSPLIGNQSRLPCTIPTAQLPVLLAVIKQFTDPRCLSPSHSFVPIKKTRRVWGIHKKRFTNNPDYNPWSRECEWRDRRRRTDPKIIRSKNRPSLLRSCKSIRRGFTSYLFTIHQSPDQLHQRAAFTWSDWLAELYASTVL